MIGFLRPTVLLPEGILKTLTRSQMEAVLAHELSHARRRDNLTAAIHMIVEALFWFYPLVWWIGARLVEERERACDESVLTQGSEPREYADAILNVCKDCVKSPVVCVSGIIGSDLKRRIVRIMARRIGQGLTPGRKVLLGGAAAVAIAIPLALGMTGVSARGMQGAEASNGPLPWFKTASIKRNGAPAAEIWASGKEFVAIEPTINMIMFAYGEKYPLKPTQVLGGPDWMKTEVFNVDVELPKSLSDQIKPPLSAIGPYPMYPRGVRRTDAMKRIFRSLLINRFKLRVKHETKVLPVLELVLAKNGPKFTEDKIDNRPCRWIRLGPGKGPGLDLRSCDFRAFVGLLSASPGARSRVLLDKAGLHGRYSFKLHWAPTRPAGAPKPAPGGQINSSAAPPESSGAPFFTALREQLGLNIVSARAPVDVIVIEHIERPSGN